MILKAIDEANLDVETEIMIAEADADWRSMLDRALDLGVTGLLLSACGYVQPRSIH
ncbi:hypothetical protein [Paenibacillus borealis]|uniref:hypothetical protein n=1 Tax=Paenibacillus borealis TaxID=160799 RepID=UPI000A728832|nr:hypothetical protein [Paenibacillus borealis]